MTDRCPAKHSGTQCIHGACHDGSHLAFAPDGPIEWDYCGAEHNGYTCTRHEGHTGPHKAIAHSRDRVHHRWRDCLVTDCVQRAFERGPR